MNAPPPTTLHWHGTRGETLTRVMFWTRKRRDTMSSSAAPETYSTSIGPYCWSPGSGQYCKQGCEEKKYSSPRLRTCTGAQGTALCITGSVKWHGEGLLAQGVAPRWDAGPMMSLLSQDPWCIAGWRIPQLVEGPKLKGQVRPPPGIHIAHSPLQKHNS